MFTTNLYAPGECVLVILSKCLLLSQIMATCMNRCYCCKGCLPCRRQTSILNMCASDPHHDMIPYAALVHVVCELLVAMIT